MEIIQAKSGHSSEGPFGLQYYHVQKWLSDMIEDSLSRPGCLEMEMAGAYTKR